MKSSFIISAGKHNLKDYEETYNTFDWKDVEQQIPGVKLENEHGI